MDRDVTQQLCAAVCRHLAEERDYLDEIRRCVLEWPSGLVPSPQTATMSLRMAELEAVRDRLWGERDRLLTELQMAFRMPGVRRFSAFEWNECAGRQLDESLREIRNSVARLSGAMRASRRTLQFWSATVTELLAGMSGGAPHVARYSSAGRRVDAAEHAVHPTSGRSRSVPNDADARVSGS